MQAQEENLKRRQEENNMFVQVLFTADNKFLGIFQISYWFLVNSRESRTQTRLNLEHGKKTKKRVSLFNISL